MVVALGQALNSEAHQKKRTFFSFVTLPFSALCSKIATMKSAQILLASYPKGWVSESDFEITTIEFEDKVRPGSGDVLLRLVWISADPYLRGRMNPEPEGLYIQHFELGKPIETGCIGKVVDSDSPNFKPGDIVLGQLPVSEYVLVSKGQGIKKIDDAGVPSSYYLGVLGMPSMTAWVGLMDIGKLKAGDEVYVSAASGAVGLVVGQLAKLKGCRVVGSAGSDVKVRLLKEYGFDDAFNYKTEADWDATLSRLFPQGIDLYFENVGGRMLEAVLNNMNTNGRIVACGMISQYNQDWKEREGVRNLLNIVGKCIKMEGFVLSYHSHKFPKFLDEVLPLVKEGKIKYREHVSEGIENFPKAFIGMLKGENIGKALVHVGDPL